MSNFKSVRSLLSTFFVRTARAILCENCQGRRNAVPQRGTPQITKATIGGQTPGGAAGQRMDGDLPIWDLSVKCVMGVYHRGVTHVNVWLQSRSLPARGRVGL
jgi:hypothetical protein